MAFQQGLSGLNTSSKALDVISNNIANAATVGFKAGQAQFADVYAASLGIGGGSQVGIGASLAVVQQQFSQGNISTSNNPLDIAVNGSGFFRMQKSETDQTITYTRNGQFHLDAKGYVVNAQSKNLTGYGIDNEVTNRAALVPVKLDTTGVPPLATGMATSNAGIQTQINLDDRDLKSLTSASPNNLNAWSSNAKFPPDDLNTFNYSTSVTVYDQKGNDHALSMYFTRVGNSADNNGSAGDLWQVHYVLDDQDITGFVKSNTGVVDPTKVPTLQFNQQGGIVTGQSSVVLPEQQIQAAGANLQLNFVPLLATGNTFTVMNQTTGLALVNTGDGVTESVSGDPIQLKYAPDRTVNASVPFTVENSSGVLLVEGADYSITAGGLITNPGGAPITVKYTANPGDYQVSAAGLITYNSGVAATDNLQVDYQAANPGMAVNSIFDIDTTALSTGLPQFSGLFTKNIPINYASSTVFGSGYDVNKLVQDGYPYGRLSGVSVSGDGVLRGSYSNGQTKGIAQLVLVDFTAPTGLSSLGNNQWAETSASGQALIGDPGAGNRGLLQSAAVEDANVDLTQELVNLITFQRNYQANAQSIKTQDQVMQTLVNLR